MLCAIWVLPHFSYFLVFNFSLFIQYCLGKSAVKFDTTCHWANFLGAEFFQTRPSSSASSYEQGVPGCSRDPPCASSSDADNRALQHDYQTERSNLTRATSLETNPWPLVTTADTSSLQWSHSSRQGDHWQCGQRAQPSIADTACHQAVESRIWILSLLAPEQAWHLTIKNNNRTMLP